MSEMINDLIKTVEDRYDADIYLISTAIYEQVVDDVNMWLCNTDSIRLHKNLILMLRTYGGSPDAAYKIARSFQRFYKTCDASRNEPKKRK